jgi:hypothetical protein
MPIIQEMMLPILLELTILLTIQQQNTKHFLDTRNQLHTMLSMESLTLMISLPQLIGEHWEQLIHQRIKDLADHAGLSQLLLQLKEETKLKLELFIHSQNNNW